jgi:predicted DNA-binding transcriptional regulator AlpA
MNTEIIEQVTTLRRTQIKQMQTITNRLTEFEKKLESMQAQLTITEEILSIADAARFLGYSEGYFRNYYLKANIPHKKGGSKVMFLKSEILQWLTDESRAGNKKAARAAATQTR